MHPIAMYIYYTPLQRRPVHSASVQSPGHLHCQNVAGFPPDDDCMSLDLQRCWPDAPYLVAEKHGDQCCTLSLQPEKETGTKNDRHKDISHKCINHGIQTGVLSSTFENCRFEMFTVTVCLVKPKVNENCVKMHWLWIMTGL